LNIISKVFVIGYLQFIANLLFIKTKIFYLIDDDIVADTVLQKVSK